MSIFIRRSKLRFTVTFTPPVGVVLVPRAAHATLTYTDTSGATRTDTFDLTLDANGSWFGDWDSSNARQGRVEWMAWSEGNVQAATQGSFEIKANKANLAIG